MSRKYKFHVNDKLYFISFAVVNWIDVFIKEEYKNVVIESWKYCQEKKGLEIYGWCIMTSVMSIMKLRFEREFSQVNCESQQLAPENSRLT